MDKFEEKIKKIIMVWMVFMLIIFGLAFTAFFIKMIFLGGTA